MTAEILLDQLRRRGVVLTLDDAGGLRFSAPKGAMTEHRRAQVAEHRADVIELLLIERVHAIFTHPRQPRPTSSRVITPRHRPGDRPSWPCSCCKSDAWRRHLMGAGWVCDSCHPNPHRLRAEWLAEKLAGKSPKTVAPPRSRIPTPWPGDDERQRINVASAIRHHEDPSSYPEPLRSAVVAELARRAGGTLM